ncbi:GMP/IMP nucleotidase [Cocleimonas sp. KMM 6892]|uniref:GMP/IMP nucleotidase n=1 Tax=unclassified Cocleimonas TaxID=2639732 RepID=UPI002DB5F58C|nr:MULTISPECIES: GMP/IMP nucleotidase [unclassified Cocleimonas]MEB8431241.1 GMP/IMP nucleotidase [Cocleimonas sp. KMM 6892]MEC4713987.1 GMP/IMP nucleotidase [Cocleimonas sp. KMM 6895]MEC4743318.1 GMP/IMP nucleotidase [Cocleimonas sp. KMM 6896]
MKAIPIDWQNISTVFLDMDGTLLDLHYDNHFWLEHIPKRYAEKHGLSINEASELLEKKTSAIAGTLDWYCLDYWQDNLDMDIVSLKHEVAEKIAIRENVVEFLEHLRALNKRIVLLTNAHKKTIEVKFSYVSIEQYFDRIITSHDIGIAKEEDGFWDELEKTEAFSREQSLFIDDNLDVLKAAQKSGVKHLLSISRPDSNQAAKDTEHFIAVDCYSQLLTSNN